jgi:hypothetical protein
MENLDPRQVQTNRVTVIKLRTIDDVDHYEQVLQISLRSRQGFRPHNYVRYNTFVTFYAWLVARSLASPFLSFHIIFLLTSTGQTGEPISIVDGSNDVFPPKEVPFWGLIGKI